MTGNQFVSLVVLVNNGTASAAEILAGAIQDHDVGLVVGALTWGKGLVQTVYNLSYGTGIALTTAKYYTPSGRLIQRDYSSYYDYYYNHFGDEGDDTTGGMNPSSKLRRPCTRSPGCGTQATILTSGRCSLR